MKNKSEILLYWIARIVAALIMVQTLYFKFSAAPESVYIFKTVHMEPWGRILVGTLELIASVILFIPRFVWLGAALALSLMIGAIGMHLTFLGISVMADGGYLFSLAIVVAICSVYILWLDREQVLAQYGRAKKLFS